MVAVAQVGPHHAALTWPLGLVEVAVVPKQNQRTFRFAPERIEDRQIAYPVVVKTRAKSNPHLLTVRSHGRAQLVARGRTVLAANQIFVALSRREPGYGKDRALPVRGPRPYIKLRDGITGRF